MTILRISVEPDGLTPSQQIAVRVKALVNAHPWSGSRIAMAIGMSQKSFSRRIGGESPWSVDELAELAAVLKVDWTDLTEHKLSDFDVVTVEPIEHDHGRLISADEETVTGR